MPVVATTHTIIVLQSSNTVILFSTSILTPPSFQAADAMAAVVADAAAAVAVAMAAVAADAEAAVALAEGEARRAERRSSSSPIVTRASSSPAVRRMSSSP